MKLYLMVAPPGAGKTTFATNIMNGTIRISQDDLGREKHIKEFHRAIEDKLDIVVDRLNFNKEQRERYLKPARDAGYTTEIIVIHCPRQTCFDRMMERQNHPTINGFKSAGDFTNFQTYDHNEKERQANAALDTFFTKYQRVENIEADVVTRLGWDGKKPTAIWIDIDNTLANTAHRNHFIVRTEEKKPNWKGFFDNMGDDTLNVWCRDIMRKYDNVVICSGRPDSHRKITESWLLHNQVQYNHLFMRHRSDFRKDDIVKLQIYEFEVKTRFNLLFAIDDRDQVVKILRENGITVLQCNYGDF